VLSLIGYALGGEAGARLAEHIGLETSADTQDLILGHLALTLVPNEQGEYESASLATADQKTERGKCVASVLETR